jgi:hypothetical protein
VLEGISISIHCFILDSNTLLIVHLVCLCMLVDYVLICDDNETPISISRTGLQFQFGWKF